MSEYSVSARYYISDDSYVVEVYDDPHLKELQDEFTEVESFDVNIPDELVAKIRDDSRSETIYTQASQSDGYISIFYYLDEKLAKFHFDLDEEGFGATDSEDSFTCSGFPRDKLSSVGDILDCCVYYKSQLPSARHYLESNHPELLDEWNKRWEEDLDE